MNLSPTAMLCSINSTPFRSYGMKSLSPRRIGQDELETDVYRLVARKP